MRRLAQIEGGKVVNVFKAQDLLTETQITGALQLRQGELMQAKDADENPLYDAATIDTMLADYEAELRLDPFADHPEAGAAGIGWDYDADTGFSEPVAVEAYADLTKRQFEFLLALTGFDAVWDALAAAAKAANDVTTYAGLIAERAGSRFRHDVTLITVGAFRDQAALIAPEVDLSDAAINTAWKQAEQFQGVSGA